MAAGTTPATAFGTAITWAGHDIGYATNINGPNIKVDTIDASSHDSADTYREYIAGLRDGGEVSLDVRFIPGDTTGQKYFISDLHEGTERQVVITLPDSSTWTFNALATGFSPSDPHDAALGATLTMKVTGKPVFSES